MERINRFDLEDQQQEPPAAPPPPPPPAWPPALPPFNPVTFQPQPPRAEAPAAPSFNPTTFQPQWPRGQSQPFVPPNWYDFAAEQQRQAQPPLSGPEYNPELETARRYRQMVSTPITNQPTRPNYPVQPGPPTVPTDAGQGYYVPGTRDVRLGQGEFIPENALFRVLINGATNAGLPPEMGSDLWTYLNHAAQKSGRQVTLADLAPDMLARVAGAMKQQGYTKPGSVPPFGGSQPQATNPPGQPQMGSGGLPTQRWDGDLGWISSMVASGQWTEDFAVRYAQSLGIPRNSVLVEKDRQIHRANQSGRPALAQTLTPYAVPPPTAGGRGGEVPPPIGYNPLSYGGRLRT